MSDPNELKPLSHFCADLKGRCVKMRMQRSSMEGSSKKLKVLRKVLTRQYTLEFLEEAGKPVKTPDDVWKKYSRVKKWRILVNIDVSHPGLRDFFECIGEKDEKKKFEVVEQVFNIIYDDRDSFFKCKKIVERDDPTIQSIFRYLDEYHRD